MRSHLGTRIFFQAIKYFYFFFISGLIIFNSFGINSNGFNKIENIKNKLGDKKILLDKPLKTMEIVNLQKTYLKQDYEKFISKNNKLKILFLGDSHAEIYI